MENLQSLSLSHNLITSLPSEMSALRLLSLLHMDHNGLKSLPESFFLLESLRDLNVAHNELEALPASIQNLRRLEKLDVSHNAIEEIPDLSKLLELSKLNLRGNEITTIDPKFFQLAERKLRVVDISKNNLDHFPLPENPLWLTGLTTFDFAFNAFVSLPIEMRFADLVPDPDLEAVKATYSGLDDEAIAENEFKIAKRAFIPMDETGLARFLNSIPVHVIGHVYLGYLFPPHIFCCRGVDSSS